MSLLHTPLKSKAEAPNVYGHKNSKNFLTKSWKTYPSFHYLCAVKCNYVTSAAPNGGFLQATQACNELIYKQKDIYGIFFIDAGVGYRPRNSQHSDYLQR